MAIYRFGDKEPTIGKECFIADSAEVIGDVVIGDGCYIGYKAILRGDYGAIRIGEGTAIEEGVILHVPPEMRMTLGKRVTVGHGAVVHGIAIGDDVVIGMKAVVSWGCEIGTWSIIAEGAVLKNFTQIPEGKLVVGVPGKIHGDVTEENKTLWRMGKQLYRDLAREAPGKLKRLD